MSRTKSIIPSLTLSFLALTGCQINPDLDEQSRKETVKQLGLPKKATWEDISQHYSEQSRKEFAEKYGLPEDSTWKDITQHQSEQSRKQYAKEAGLPEDTTWEDLSKYYEAQPHREPNIQGTGEYKPEPELITI